MEVMALPNKLLSKILFLVISIKSRGAASTREIMEIR